MNEFLWRMVARVATHPRVFGWLVRRASANPYSPIMSKDGADLYMWRGWIFNPYGKDARGEITAPRWQWLPSIRVHRIMRPDRDRHLHDHPWNARTIVLHNWYEEERPGDNTIATREVFMRRAGYTGRLMFGQYHRISAVPEDGVWTLFFTWRKRGTWGFDVDGHKVPWREYLGVE